MSVTRIEWTDNTWNPWMGCYKVSQGCLNCYMYREQRRYGHDPKLIRRSRTTFNDPLSWARKVNSSGRRRVFVCSWSDFFIRQADPWREEAWDVIRRTPQLIYLILTKRPELALERLPHDWGEGWGHVWLGASIEDQPSARLRVPRLLQIPATHRFLSCEPLLGPIDLVVAIPADCDIWDAHNTTDDDLDPTREIDEGVLDYGMYIHNQRNILNSLAKDYWERDRQSRRVRLKQDIGWVIAGGESGPQARPTHPVWVRSLRDQCRAAGIPFFFKGWGEYLPAEPGPGHEELGVAYLPVGRARTGHLLDGREWCSTPEFGG